jgi:mevalonate kinase
VRDIQIFIPGKIMLAGEYAVLRGGHCLAATIDTGMLVSISWDPLAASWTINSNLWKTPKIVEDDHTPQKDILCRAVQFAAKKSGLHGGTISIVSELDVRHGLGSSSALRLGICAGFIALQQSDKHELATVLPREALHSAWQLQGESQGQASGYDIVTQFVGGLVEFDYGYQDNKWTPHWFKHSVVGLDKFVHIFVGGRGAPTAETIMTTSSWLDLGGRLEKFLDVSETLVDAFNYCLHQLTAASIKNLVCASAASRSLFIGSPNFPAKLATSLSSLPGIDKKWSWKTTGAGGEDAILLIGLQEEIHGVEAALNKHGWQRLDTRFSDHGAHLLDEIPERFAPLTDRPLKAQRKKHRKTMLRNQQVDF